MIKGFPIEFVRQIIVQTLYEEKQKNNNLFGGDNEITIHSFYEQLKSREEVDRFVETFEDLVNQQNRADLIGNGILLAPENPTITNLYSSLIIPMVWNCNMRCTLENRDQMVDTINNLIEVLKGRKVDVALLKCLDENNRVYYQPFCVGTVGEEIRGTQVSLENGQFLGWVDKDLTFTTEVNRLVSGFKSKGVYVDSIIVGSWFYVEYNGQIKVGRCSAITFDDQTLTYVYTYELISDDDTYPEIIFPQEHTSFEKYKVSLSFDTIRCDIPETLNSKEYCNITFGGSATLVNSGVALGNDLIRVAFTKKMIKGVGENGADITFSTPTKTWLEPLEMPSGNNANTQINQLISNKMISNTHTDSLAITLQYTFIADKNVALLKQWYNYARYGTQGINESDISPNMIYEIEEVSCEWGNYESNKVNAKIIESIDIENTESDTLTLGLTIQVQGANT